MLNYGRVPVVHDPDPQSLPVRTVDFWLDISSIVRHDRHGEVDKHLSRLEYIDEVCWSLQATVERILPGWEVRLNGTADQWLVKDFREQGIEREYLGKLREWGFSPTGRDNLVADDVILERSHSTGAIVVSADSFWQAKYAPHRPWMWNGRRLVHPLRVGSSGQWMFNASRGRGRSIKETLEDLLFELNPTVRTLLRRHRVSEVDFPRVSKFLESANLDVDWSSPVPPLQRETLLEIVSDAIEFRHRLAELVTSGTIEHTDAIVALVLNRQNTKEVGGELYVTEEGRKVLEQMTPRKVAVDVLAQACHDRDLRTLSVAIEMLQKSDVDGLFQIALCLQGSLASPGQIRWRGLECKEGPVRDLPLRWVVEHLRATRDRRRLATVRLVDIPRLGAVARVDVLIARHLSRNSGEWPSDLLPKLIGLPPPPRGEVPDLLGELSSHLLAHLDREDSPADVIRGDDLMLFCEMYLPGSLLHEVAMVLRGSVQPIIGALRSGRRTDAERLVRVFFIHVLSIAWIPMDISIELMLDDRIRTALGSGQVEVLTTSDQMIRLFPEISGRRGAIPDLFRVSELSGRLNALTSVLRRAEALVPAAESLVEWGMGEGRPSAR